MFSGKDVGLSEEGRDISREKTWVFLRKAVMFPGTDPDVCNPASECLR